MVKNYHYITKEEVQKVCRDLELSDWTAPGSAKVSEEDATRIREHVGGEAMKIPLSEFTQGLEIELEHGTRFPDSNVTNNHPILTGLIVLAHLKEGLDYYIRLECMELEMELEQALVERDADKSAKYAQHLAKQRMKLDAALASKIS